MHTYWDQEFEVDGELHDVEITVTMSGSRNDAALETIDVHCSTLDKKQLRDIESELWNESQAVLAQAIDSLWNA